jgi:hypothetical protein
MFGTLRRIAAALEALIAADQHKGDETAALVASVERLSAQTREAVTARDVEIKWLHQESAAQAARIQMLETKVRQLSVFQ